VDENPYDPPKVETQSLSLFLRAYLVVGVALISRKRRPQWKRLADAVLFALCLFLVAAILGAVSGCVIGIITHH
jgi:uncharacterized membrane protein SirB2